MPLAHMAICKAAAMPLEAGGRDLSLGVGCTTACTATNDWNHAGEGWIPPGAPCDGWMGAGVVLACIGCAGAGVFGADGLDLLLPAAAKHLSVEHANESHWARLEQLFWYLLMHESK